MDRELNGHKFVAGDRFTIADITALVAIDIGNRLAEIKIAPELAHLTRWYETVSSRPSAGREISRFHRHCWLPPTRSSKDGRCLLLAQSRHC
jgi:glutathione S-transferase